MIDVEKFMAEFRTKKLAELNAKYHLKLQLPRDEAQFTVLEKADIDLGQCKLCTGYPCEKPENKYQKAVITNGQVRWRECGAVEQRTKDRIKRAKLPLVYASKTFEDYEQTDQNERAIGLAYWLMENFPNSLYLYGSCGTGKTFLATLIAKEMVLRGRSVVFGDVPTLLDDIKATFSKDTTARPEDVIRHYANCDLLVLDDVGTGRMSDWHVNIIYQVVNARYNASKAIIVTGNYPFSGLEKRLGQGDELTAKRIISRLKGMCQQAYLGSKDRRV